jgi:hypothetical protein
MRFHFGGLRPGQLRFDLGTMSYGKHPDRQTLRRWMTHRIGEGSWGVSFGPRLFIGVLRLEDSKEVRERIK